MGGAWQRLWAGAPRVQFLGRTCILTTCPWHDLAPRVLLAMLVCSYTTPLCAPVQALRVLSGALYGALVCPWCSGCQVPLRRLALPWGSCGEQSRSALSIEQTSYKERGGSAGNALPPEREAQ